MPDITWHPIGHLQFEETAQLADKIRQQNGSHIQRQHLSMGMSNDYQLAVTAGATMVSEGTNLICRWQ